MDDYQTQQRSSGFHREYITFFLGGLLLLILPLILLASHTTNQTRSYASGYAFGDVNHDGKVDLQDVAAIREAIANGEYVKSADLNNDGKVDAQDIEAFYNALSLKK